MMARSITASRIHKRWCNSHDTLGIKMVTLQGRAEQKLDWHFDLHNTTTLTQSWIWMKVLEFVSPSHSEIERLGGPQG